MKRLAFFTLGVLILSTLSYASYKKFNSSTYQSLLLYDFNNGTNFFKLKDENKFDYDFPNITATALPIKYLVARYYLKIDSIEDAKELLHRSIKDNPYIFAPEVLLSQIYLNEKNIDSALYYSKKAFYGLSDNNRHRDTYFKVLREIKDSIGLDSAFAKIKNKNKEEHWYDYIISRNDINKVPQKKLLELVEELRIRFPKTDTLKLNSIKRFIELGSDRYTTALVNSEKGNIEFSKNNFNEAINYYELAISLDDRQYLFYENAAIAYENLNNILKAEEYFDKVIYDFKSFDGRSEFFKGLMLLKNNRKDEGCKYLFQSATKNYVGNVTNIKAIDVFAQLCKR